MFSHSSQKGNFLLYSYLIFLAYSLRMTCMHLIYFHNIHTTQPSNSFHILPFHHPPNFKSFLIFFYNLPSPVWVSHTFISMGPFTGVWPHQSETTPVTKADSPLSIIHHCLWHLSLQRTFAYYIPAYGRMLTVLTSCSFCPCSYGCCEILSAGALSCPEEVSCQCSLTSDSCHPSLSSSALIPQTCGE